MNTAQISLLRIETVKRADCRSLASQIPAEVYTLMSQSSKTHSTKQSEKDFFTADCVQQFLTEAAVRVWMDLPWSLRQRLLNFSKSALFGHSAYWRTSLTSAFKIERERKPTQKHKTSYPLLGIAVHTRRTPPTNRDANIGCKAFFSPVRRIQAASKRKIH